MKNKLILNTKTYRRRVELLLEKKYRYESRISDEQIYNYQLKKFNDIWFRTKLNNHFYSFWAKKHNLPDQIIDLDELAKFPILTKEDIQNNSDLIFKDLNNFNTISTGGSSGQPTKFPTTVHEKNLEYANAYLGRSWWNISPLDETVLFWGHSHLFGTGVKGVFNNHKRKFLDYLLNTSRFNAYDMTANNLQKYFYLLLNKNPRVIIGYSSLLFKLSKFILENNLQIGDKSNLQCVIVTSETVYDQDISLIETVFKVPVVIEYGMAEAGVIAYSKKNTRTIPLFWDSFIGLISKDKLTITTLNNRIFPLINYNTDDSVAVSRFYKNTVLEISEISGRSQVLVSLMTNEGGVIYLSGILIVHILKSYPGIYSIHFENGPLNHVVIYFTSDLIVETNKIKKYFLGEIRKDHPNIDSSSIDFVQTYVEKRTLAGKSIY